MPRLTQATARAVSTLMHQRNVRQVDVASVLNITQAQVSRRLSGHVPFTLDDLERLAAYLEVPATQLLEPPALLVDDDASDDGEATS